MPFFTPFHLLRLLFIFLIDSESFISYSSLFSTASIARPTLLGNSLKPFWMHRLYSSPPFFTLFYTSFNFLLYSLRRYSLLLCIARPSLVIYSKLSESTDLAFECLPSRSAPLSNSLIQFIVSESFISYSSWSFIAFLACPTLLIHWNLLNPLT